MTDLKTIHVLIARARRRLRLQQGLEWATTAAIAGVGGALLVLWFFRWEELSARGAVIALAVLGAGVVLSGVAGALRRVPRHLVSNRLDRASGLADRFSSACDFEERLQGQAADHPDTRALMELAIADAVAAAPRARVAAAAPFRTPHDTRALAAFLAVGGLVSLLRFGPEKKPPPRPHVVDSEAAARKAAETADANALDPDDLEAQKQFVADMKEMAQQTQDSQLADMAKELEDLVAKAEKGELSKQELLSRMDALEQKYMKSSGESAEKMLGDLKNQAQALKKEPVTKRLGDALEAGDLASAQKELERLAEQIQKGEMKKEDQQKLAQALEKAADQHEQQQKKEDQKADEQAQKQIDKQKEEIRKLERKIEQEPKDEEAKRKLDREKRELERLERDRQDKKEQAQKRQLDRLSRDMKKTAESLKNQKQEEAADNMKRAADDTKKVEDEIKKINNQKKVQSQLADLKEAIRRAKPKKGNGRGQQMAQRQQRIREYERRAGGQQGDSRAWRPGQSGGEGKENGQDGQGGQKDSRQWGDQHDPNVQGDATPHLDAKLKDEELSGIHGKGPSTRETILTSAQKGFATTSYKRVYADYKKIVEEVMNQEKVPQGYKYYVKRYFQRIKPHSME